MFLLLVRRVLRSVSKHFRILYPYVDEVENLAQELKHETASHIGVLLGRRVCRGM